MINDDQINIYMSPGKGDKKGKDGKGKKKDSKEDKAPAIVSNLCLLAATLNITFSVSKLTVEYS